MELYYVIILVFTLLSPIVNLFRGKRVATFERRATFKPLILILIAIQSFAVLLSFISNSGIILSVLILFCQVILLLYEMRYVKNGIYENALIIDGLFYDLKLVNDFCFNNNTLELTIGKQIKVMTVKSDDINMIRLFFESKCK